jgi:3-hydroxyisobutyrate dehydrogenase-like beta-hydroxyacid dehydrogenase
MSKKIAFIGLGSMGGQMAHHLLRGGYTLAVYARRASVMQPFVDAGAHAASSPADAAREADFICTNVTTTADVEAVLLGGGGGRGGVIESAKPGAIVCDFSTIDVVATRRIAAALAIKKIDFLDCPVSGGEKAAAAAALSIMVGGKTDVLERARPLLETLGKTISHMGDVGSGQITKACNQIVQVVNIQGIAEAMLFARANGVDAAKVVDALMAGMAGSKMLDLMGRKMAARDFDAGIQARLHAKDFALVAHAAAEQNLPMPAVALVHQQLSQLMAHGWGNMDTCNLLRVLEETELEKTT